MKKFLALLLSLSLSLCLCACGSTKELEQQLVESELQAQTLQGFLDTAMSQAAEQQAQLDTATAQAAELQTQLDAATAQVTELQAEKESLEADLAAAQAELDELKNGPAAKLAEVRTAHAAQDWKKVISLGNALHSKYPGTDQDLEAMSLVAAAQKILDDEAAKAAAEAAKTKEDKVHGLIRITRLDCSSPNSAGGVGINLHFVNMHPEKTIKYLEVTVRPYNAVGDSQSCEIRNYTSYTCEATGPYAPGGGINAQTGWWWPNAWYNNTIKTIKLTGVSIEYMDGSYVTLKSDELPFAIW